MVAIVDPETVPTQGGIQEHHGPDYYGSPATFVPNICAAAQGVRSVREPQEDLLTGDPMEEAVPSMSPTCYDKEHGARGPTHATTGSYGW